jgi:Na+-transporting NADH:ubiquinone oxidoreductase subunit A
MLKKIKIHQGVNLNIDGEAEKIIVDLPRSRTYGVKPDDFFTIVPKLLVKEGDKVKNGTPLFFSKKNPRINFVSPVSGIVTSIVRGPKRKILEIIIDDDNK